MNKMSLFVFGLLGALCVSLHVQAESPTVLTGIGDAENIVIGMEVSALAKPGAPDQTELSLVYRFDMRCSFRNIGELLAIRVPGNDGGRVHEETATFSFSSETNLIENLRHDSAVISINGAAVNRLAERAQAMGCPESRIRIGYSVAPDTQPMAQSWRGLVALPIEDARLPKWSRQTSFDREPYAGSGDEFSFFKKVASVYRNEIPM